MNHQITHSLTFITEYCKVGNGFSAINNVMNTDTSSSGYYSDNQESFFFAEVLKYVLGFPLHSLLTCLLLGIRI